MLNRCAIGLLTLSGAAHGQVLTPPTPDQPVLLIQPYQPEELHDWPLSELCQWWPCSGPFNRNMIPMIPLNPNAVPGGMDPALYAEKLHRYYTTFVDGETGSGHLNATQRAEYEARLAVEFFNFGGDLQKTRDPSLNHAVEFWHRLSGDDLAPSQQLGGEFRYVNPWMTNRIGQIQTFMENFLNEWTSGVFAIPAPRGGVYFDNEILMYANTLWASVLQDEARWSSTPLPGSTETLATLWNQARVKYGWPQNPSDMLVLDQQLDALDLNPWTGHGNRDFLFWLGDIGERVLTGATNVTACEPLWSHDWNPDPQVVETLDFPIANYGDYFVEQRLNQPEERFGWHVWRPDPADTQDLVPSRDGWFGQIVNVRDDYGGSFGYGGEKYCDGCRKHPYLMGSEIPGYEDVIIGAYARENGRYPTGSHHAPVLYTLYTNEEAPSTSLTWLTYENLYVPQGHPQRIETADDATVRESRFTLDSIGFSGVSPDELVPWILPPDDQGGVTVQGVNQKSTRDLFRRMLMLMRSKEVSRIQVFNMKMFPLWYRSCAERIYNEVYGYRYAGLQSVLGTPASGPDLEFIRNTLPGVAGRPQAFSVASAHGTDWGKSATAVEVDFQTDAVGFEMTPTRGLRLVFECEVTEGPEWTGTDPATVNDFCAAGLRGMVLLWNWGTLYSAPGWLKVNVGTVDEPGYYDFPGCFAGDPFDLSMRREISYCQVWTMFRSSLSATAANASYCSYIRPIKDCPSFPTGISFRLRSTPQAASAWRAAS